ncbi:TlyA family RNA methyltransferase [Scrofimicrobium canadense]|uniref:TlyA family RNA methyltransferase n=1 Tax=Scrofimicrobium canadense TaxID=2652290 RepID=UPI0012B36F56
MNGLCVALRRLDNELVRRNLAKSRTAAQEMIHAKRVKVSGAVAHKAATQVDTAAPIVIIAEPGGGEYASRGAYKLIGALDALGDRVPHIRGRNCLDAGASTGGFTDVLLRRGAAHVIAVDVGYGQLAWNLQTDSRVQIMDRTNIRYLKKEDIAVPIDLVVGDLSFISLELIIPALVDVAPEADFLLMVKPQFEVGKGRLGSGGVVRDPADRIWAVVKIAHFAQNLGMDVWAIEASPLPGPAGNVEYFVCFSPQGRHEPIVDIEAAARRAVEMGPQGIDNG